MTVGVGPLGPGPKNRRALKFRPCHVDETWVRGGISFNPSPKRWGAGSEIPRHVSYHLF